VAVTSFTGPNGNSVQDPVLAGNTFFTVVVPTNRKTTVRRVIIAPYCTALGSATLAKVVLYDGTGTGASATSSAIGQFPFGFASSEASGQVFPSGPFVYEVNMPFSYVSGMTWGLTTGANCASANLTVVYD
jgi:hypothetical protein